MLSLLPVDPVGRSDVGACEPRVDGAAERRLAAQPGSEGDVGELDAEPAAKLRERAKLVQLAQAVEPVPGGRSPWDDEAGRLRGSAASAPTSRSHSPRHPTVSPSIGQNLNTSVSRSTERRFPPARTRPRAGRRRRAAASRPRGSSCPRAPGRGARCPAVIRNAAPGVDHLSRRRLLPRSRHLDLCSPLEHVPRLVLLPVELHRESLAGVDDEQLAAVVIGERPDQLVAPRLVDAPGLEGPAVEQRQVRRQASLDTRRSSHSIPGNRSGCDSTNSCAIAGPWGCSRSARGPRGASAPRRPSAASSGKVVVSWSPRSGSRAIASSSST